MNAKRRHRRRRRRDRQRAIELARWEPSWRVVDWSDAELTIGGELFASGKATVRTSGVYTIECVMVLSPCHHGAQP
jgi:hypothetical protein